jgi:molecular chaperone GrpE (heat shock protein)
MNERRIPSIAKWPFYAADLLLVGLAIWIVSHYPHPLSAWPVSLVVISVAGAALLGIWPHRAEYHTAVQFAEADGLTDAVKEIRGLQAVGEQIRLATAQWQSTQEISAKTVTTAREISDRIAAEAHAFTEFMQKANDSEKATLRLEVEKFRRGETQWVQVLVHLLDHVFALYQAGARSNQPNLEAQLGRFQEACRDVARRVGLAPFEATPDETFDAARHQLSDGQQPPPSDARIAQTLAAGYMFQGQLVRRSIVALRDGGNTDDAGSQTETNERVRGRASENSDAPPQDGSHRSPEGFRLESDSVTTGDDEMPQP